MSADAFNLGSHFNKLETEILDLRLRRRNFYNGSSFCQNRSQNQILGGSHRKFLQNNFGSF